MSRRAYIGADIFDGITLSIGQAALLENDLFCGVVNSDDVPDDFEVVRLKGGTLLPGFIDLQVNGGGGIMFNDATTVAGLRRIAAAHALTGTRAFLPTLITDTPAKTRAAIDAVEAAIAQGVRGVIGLHLEGPHLSVARKGAHDAALIRPMTQEDETLLRQAAGRLPNLMLTVAPENTTADQITRLAQAGVIVSLGHTDCSYAVAQGAIDAGASCVTHLFNAMSQMNARAPGLVGAALGLTEVSAGLIADNIHVHAASMRAAIAAKSSHGRIFLVTDAMSTVGSDIQEFHLNGRRVLRREGRLTLEDGTLAGADLDIPTALTVLRDHVGVPLDRAMAMATSVPASVLADDRGFGRLIPGGHWTGIYLDADLQYQDLAGIAF